IPWYKSQIIWVQLVAAIFAIGVRFDWWPKDLQQADVVVAIMLLVNIITGGIRAASPHQPVTLTKGAAENKNATPLA
ncbi:hypothetical protein, partial [Parvimonas micra]|uniref:hypothetical protein n=1 Tax=Parvimonas micra TaxID=33033 RepID=UPI002B4807B8